VNGGVEEAVLITGVYGLGKSSVAQEIADLLEKRNAPYALLDFGFLGWFDTRSEGRPVEHSMMLKNLAAVVGTTSRSVSGSSCSPARAVTERDWTDSKSGSPCR
jgi:hypothetical protein